MCAYWWLFVLQKWTPEILTLSATFYDLSVSRYIFSKAKKRQFWRSENRGVKITHPNVTLGVKSFVSITKSYENYRY